MNERRWRTFRHLEGELLQHYGPTWWTSSARSCFWAATVLLPAFIGVFLWRPAIVRFPIHHLWFWIPFVVIMVPIGSMITMLFVASTLAGTRFQRRVGNHFGWLAAAMAGAFIALQVGGIAWPLIARAQ